MWLCLKGENPPLARGSTLCLFSKFSKNDFDLCGDVVARLEEYVDIRLRNAHKSFLKYSLYWDVAM